MPPSPAINKAGTGYRLLATDNISTVKTGISSAFNITANAANHLKFFTQPTNTPAGLTINNATGVVVKIVDAFDNVISSNTSNVTLQIKNNPSNGTLGGPGVAGGAVTVKAVAGVATFKGLFINKAGTGYTLMPPTPALVTITSSAFNITAAVADHFRISGTGVAAVGSPFNIRVTALDLSRTP